MFVPAFIAPVGYFVPVLVMGQAASFPHHWHVFKDKPRASLVVFEHRP
jgi:hypothetical protein